MRLTPWIACAAVTLAASHAWAQLRVVSYNMLDKPASLDGPVVGYVNTVFGAIAARNVNGIAKRPDIIVLNEQTAASPGNLATILNNLYGVNTYLAVTPTSPQPQGTSDRVAFVYDSGAVSVTSTPVALPISANYPRPSIRAGFRPVGYAGADADVYVYGMHLKASNTDADALQRANQTLATRADADALPAGSNIIYAGDFNVYTANEQGYRNFFAPGNGQAGDPLNASFFPDGTPITWNNNAAFAAIHTQSTRTSPLPDGGSTGGVDDRFDYQLVSNGMLDGDGISYIGPTSPDSAANHSYGALGNNGSTFNRAINYSGNTAETSAVLDGLYNLSDHLPVIADYQLPAKMTVATTGIPTEVIQGASVSLNVSVTNSANVTSALAADALDFTVSATQTTGAVSGSVRATQGAVVGSLAVNTATPGSKLVQLNVTSTSEAVVGATFTQASPIAVYTPARPSLANDSITHQGLIDLGIVAIGQAVSGAFDVYNNPALFTAGLDLDSASVDGAASFSTGFTPQLDIGPGDSRAIGFTFAPTLSQLDEATLTVLTSDVDLPGAQSRASLVVILTARGAYAGDVNLSDTVDFDDLLVLAQHYGSSDVGWALGDFNRDGFVDFDDLLATAQNYGLGADNLHTADFAADWALARSLVPEPMSVVTLGFAGLLARRRRAR